MSKGIIVFRRKPLRHDNIVTHDVGSMGDYIMNDYIKRSFYFLYS